MVVVVGHAADQTVGVRWWCSGRRRACAVLVWVAVLLGFVGFPSVGG